MSQFFYMIKKFSYNKVKSPNSTPYFIFSKNHPVGRIGRPGWFWTLGLMFDTPDFYVFKLVVVKSKYDKLVALRVTGTVLRL